MKTEVLLLTGIFPPQVGGPAIFASRYGKWLGSRGYDCRTVTYGTSDQVLCDGSVHVVGLNRGRFSAFCKYISVSVKLTNKNSIILANGCFLEASIISSIFQRKYIAKLPGDPAWEISRNRGWTALSIEEFQQKSDNFRGKILKWVFHASIRSANHVIAPSSQLYDFSILWGIPASRISVIYNSVDSELFKPVIGSKKKFNIVMVSRLVQWKGIETVIRVAHKLRLSVAIVGDGPLMNYLTDLATSLGGRVKFFGNLSNEEVVSIMQESEIYVLNSEFEATSYSLIEAKMCGMPVISRASAGSQEVINHDVDGILVSDGDYSELVSAISELINNQNVSRSYSDNARRDAEVRFNQKINFGKILGVIMGGKND